MNKLLVYLFGVVSGVFLVLGFLELSYQQATSEKVDLEPVESIEVTSDLH